MAGSQFLQGLEGIRETEKSGIVPGCIHLHDGIGGTGFQGLRRIGVSVEILALDGDENLSGPECPGICIHAFRGEAKVI